MSVKKIFMTLIIIVACVLIGALVLNVLLPNVATQLVNAVEDTIYSATGMTFDFNGDGDSGENNTEFSGDVSDDTGTSTDNAGVVDGFN